MAGFSQGAGHGARISQTVPVHGLVMLEGGDDTCGIAPGTPANWYSDPNASLGRPHYAVRHRRFDPAWTVPASWTMLDFPTVFDDFDDAVIALEPFLVGSTNQRTASMPPPETPNNACSDHEAMAKDGCMPTGVTNQATAASADDAYLFPMYLERFCYACDAATCP